MLVRSSAALMALAIALVASGARAGTLSSATWTTDLPGLFTTAPIAVPVIASGTSTSSSVAVSLVVPPFQVGVFGTGTAFNTYRSFTLAGSQMLTATPSMAAATTGVPGAVAIKGALHVASGPNASMLTPAATTLLKIGLDVGAPGASTGYFYVSGAIHYMTVDFYGWTAGTQTFTGLTSKLSPLPSVVAMGSFMLTPMGGGSVLLVSPTRLSIDGPLAQRRVAFMSTLQLQFVPEPAGLLLLVAGGGALLLAARRS